MSVAKAGSLRTSTRQVAYLPVDVCRKWADVLFSQPFSEKIRGWGGDEGLTGDEISAPKPDDISGTRGNNSTQTLQSPTPLQLPDFRRKLEPLKSSWASK